MASRAELPTFARGLALFLGMFTLLNLIGGLLRPGFDANISWIDVRPLPALPGTVPLLISSICLLGFAFRPPRATWGRRLVLGPIGLVAVVTLWNTVEFYHLLVHGRIRPSLPVPLSLFLFAALMLIMRMVSQRVPPRPAVRTALCLGAVFVLCLAVFPLAQMVCFGKTDYRRPADVAVVFGARTYADGRPSDALADRVRTACRIYQDGVVGKLIFSGGPGDGATHETEAMRNLAVKLGVRPEDILIDRAGLNTQTTVRNTQVMFEKLQPRRVLVVSHFYHLPRIKLAYQRAGRDVQTVPVGESLRFWHPFSMAREIPALWVYYFRPLV